MYFPENASSFKVVKTDEERKPKNWGTMGNLNPAGYGKCTTETKQ